MQQSMDTIRQAHAREMKELRESLKSSSKRMHQDMGRLDREVGELRKRMAYVPEPAKKPTPLHTRILSILF